MPNSITTPVNESNLTDPESDQAVIPEPENAADEQAPLKPAWATDGESDADKEARQTAVRAAYSTAATRLREENRDAFNRLVQQEAAKLGYEWKPAPTKAERARAEIERLAREAGLSVEVTD